MYLSFPRESTPASLKLALLAVAFHAVLHPGLALGAANESNRTLSFKAAADGLITQWLVSPPDQSGISMDLAEKPPQKAALQGPTPHGGTWKLHISERKFLDLRELLDGARRGHVWAVVSVHSPTGGARTFRIHSFSKVRAYLNGKLILKKAAPLGFESDSKTVRIELPKGPSELAVAVGIRWGYCGFAAGLSNPNTSKRVPGDHFQIPLTDPKDLKNSTPIPSKGQLFSRAASFLSNTAFVKPGQKVPLVVALPGGWPLEIDTVLPRILDPDGKALKVEGAGKTPDELHTRPWQLDFTIPQKAFSHYDLSCELTSHEKVLGTKRLRLYCLAGVRTQCQALQKRLNQIQTRQSRALPLTSLALEKIEIWLDALAPTIGAKRLPWQGAESIRQRASVKTGEELLTLLKQAESYLPLESENQDPLAGQTGYLERAYQSDIDESIQPYFILVPNAAQKAIQKPKGEQRFPLIVFLHGYVEDYHKHRWWTEHKDLSRICEKHGAFMAIPFARSNADFLGPGEVDVLDVLKEVRRLYPIDADRIYLYGYSMGGMGVYSLGGHYPDIWAAGVVLAGRAYSPLLMNTSRFDALSPFKQYLIRTDQPLDLCENFVNIPLRIYHGGDDQIIPRAEAQVIADRLKALGCDARLSLRPGDHWFGFELMGEEEPVEWMLKQKRPRQPAKARLKNFSLRFGNLHNLRLRHVTGALKPFNIEWQLKDQQLNLTRLDGPIGHLDLSGRSFKTVHFEKPGYAQTATGGGEGHAKDQEKTWKIARSDWLKPGEENTAHPNWKTPVRCGPVKEATYGPFLVVYGTQGNAATTQRLRGQAQDFADEWYAFAKGFVAVKADSQVSPEEKQSKNLILFGEEQENSLHAEAAASAKLPFSVKDGLAQVGAQSYSLKNRGILYIYPSPFDKDANKRSVVISAGVRYGAHLPINHKLDLVPDYILYESGVDEDGTGTNRPVAAGFFNGKWKFSEELTFRQAIKK